MDLRIGTAEGLIGPDGARSVDGPLRVFGDAVLTADGRILWHTGGTWRLLDSAPGLLCALDAPGGLLLGTEGAHLLRVAPDRLTPVVGFERVEGRDRWYTPWGGPPDLRSLARTEDNVLLASVHVGGIPRSLDGGRTWSPTIDIEADVHQVRGVWGRTDLVVAAAAVGFCLSLDAGATWTVRTEGLHATYCRAVAVGGDHAYLSASEGPRGRDCAIYRTRLGGAGPLERITDPIRGNVDAHALDAHGDRVVFGTRDGTVWQSEDAGDTWVRLLDGLAPVTSLSLVP